ncbi:MAG: hypothetical protein AAF624_02265 [Bacteroidota bacterium]
MATQLRCALWLLIGIGLSGCVATTAPASSSGSDSVVRSALRQFVPTSGDSLSLVEQLADQAEALRYAEERLQRYGWTPAAGASYLQRHPGAASADSGQAHVLSLLPGRDGRVRNDLVIVAADLDGAGAAAAISVARRLAERAIYDHAPGRTVLLGLWGAPRNGTRGFGDLARFPGWVPSQVAAVFYATADTTDAPAVRATLAPFENAAVVMVTPPEAGREGTSDLERMQRAREVAAVVRWADVLTEAVVTAAAAESP